jgi:hypothetical protein
VAAVWPSRVVALADVGFLWQPALLLTLAVMTFARSGRGWSRAVGQSLWLYLVVNVATWLPHLRTTAFWAPDYAYPEAYGRYLVLYETGIAGLIAFQAGLALNGRDASWWTSGGWSRPLVLAPIWLVARGVQTGLWATSLTGVIVGLAAATAHGVLWTAPSLRSARVTRVIAVAVFLVGAVLAYGSAMRIYALEGANYPAASDDGLNYYHLATLLVKEPALFWNIGMGDVNFFSGYYVAMGLWFMIAGPHMPSWLVWHGAAGGLLALAGYCLGARLGGPAWGVIAAGLVVADRVTLHLLATMNMETFFVPLVYFSLVAWLKAGEAVGRRASVLSHASGALLGLATIARPTGALLPVVFGAAALGERGTRRRRECVRQVVALAAAFAIVLLPMLVRHRIAWGEWSLGGWKSRYAVIENRALRINGQNPIEIGWLAWSALIVDDPGVIWRTMIPGWWHEGLRLWTNQGFGQMDLIRGLNHSGTYQAALRMAMMLCGAAAVVVMMGRRTRLDLVLLGIPAYFTSMVLVFWVIGSRYRAPFIPALYLLACAGLLLASAPESAPDRDDSPIRRSGPAQPAP